LTDELLKWRSEFPILDRAVYLISHSLGAMPKQTYTRLQDYADTWATRGVRAWAEGWWDMPVSVGNELAPIIGAEPGCAWIPKGIARDKLGYILTGVDALRSGQWPLSDREPCALETTVPRILAAGDIRSGSTKRVGFAVGDGSLAVTCVHKLTAIRS